MTTVNRERTLDTIIEKSIIFLLIFTPLAFGTVQPWSISLMEIAAFSIFGVWLVKLWMRNEITIVRAPFLVFLGRLILLAAFQLVPLPQRVLSALSPSTANIYTQFLEPGNNSWHTLSIYPDATKEEMYKLLAYGAIFLVIINHYRTREQIRAVVQTIVVMGTALAVFAVVQKMSWNGELFWFYPVRAGLHPMGPYINRNHFAGYMEMAIPLCAGLLLYRASKIKIAERLPLMKKIEALAGTEHFPAVVLLSLAVLLMSAGLFLSLSRGGIIGFGVSMVIFVFMARTRRSLRSKIGVIAVVGLLIFFFVVLAGWGRIEDRFAEVGNEAKIKRPQVWMDSLGLIKDFPLWGSGLGTFISIFPQYQSKYPTIIFEHAENDYIEILTDMGVTGFLILAVMIAHYLRAVVTSWRGRRSIYAKCMGVGGTTSCVAILVHSMGDFNMRIPANAMLLTIIAAITYSVVIHKSKSGEENHYDT